MCNCSTFKSPLSLCMWWSPSSLVLSVPVQKTSFSLHAGTQEKFPVSQIHSSAYNMLILTMSSLTLRRFLWRTLLYNLLFYPPCISLLILDRKKPFILINLYYYFLDKFKKENTVSTFLLYKDTKIPSDNSPWKILICDIHSGKHA